MSYSQGIPVDSGYVQILGYAVYNFTYLEWIVIWSTEKLAPGILNTHVKMPAGKVALAFEASLMLTNSLSKNVNDELLKASKTFRALIEKRNDLLHSHPYTAPGGEQRLGRQLVEWKMSDLEQFAHEVEDAAIHLNDIFHTHLK